MTLLWPPLSQIRADLLREAGPPAEAPLIRRDEASPPPPAPSHPEALLIELAQRRQAARAHFAEQPWEPGCIVLVRQGHAHVGVLLDRQDAPGALWHGWMTSAEPDWAGWHDVLLEPGDEPADPSASVVQTWNRVHLPEKPQTSAVLARLSPARLAAMRAVWTESLDPLRSGLSVGPAPGRVALRETQDGHTVLTGTPVGANDPRLEHQALYRNLGQDLIAAAQPSSATKAAAPSPPSVPSWWSRLRSALRPKDLLRPAFALLALVVVAQQWMIWQGGEEDNVRFRSLAPATEPPALMVRWQPSTRVEEAQALLSSLPAGPDTSILPDGRWLVEVDDLAAAHARLSASPLVQSVQEP